jgi:TonB family protein
MRKISIALSVFLISSTGFQTFAREKTQTPQTATQDTTERPKNTVDKMIDEAKNRGEVVVQGCLYEDLCDSNLEIVHVLELPQPDYPPIARAAHASGEVQVQVLIDLDGKVIAAVAISGHPLLQGASVSAARKARFSPVKQNDESVKVTGVLKYTFVMQ